MSFRRNKEEKLQTDRPCVALMVHCCSAGVAQRKLHLERKQMGAVYVAQVLSEEHVTRR